MNKELEQAITELAKTLYINPEFSALGIRDTIRVFLSNNHLVQLDKDQSLPDMSEDVYQIQDRGIYRHAQQDMFEARFRKVKE